MRKSYIQCSIRRSSSSKEIEPCMVPRYTRRRAGAAVFRLWSNGFEGRNGSISFDEFLCEAFSILSAKCQGSRNDTFMSRT